MELCIFCNKNLGTIKFLRYLRVCTFCKGRKNPITHLKGMIDKILSGGLTIMEKEFLAQRLQCPCGEASVKKIQKQWIEPYYLGAKRSRDNWQYLCDKCSKKYKEEFTIDF